MADDALSFFDSLSGPQSVPVGPNGIPRVEITGQEPKPDNDAVSFFDNIAQHNPQKPAKEYGYGETALRHAGQGLTMGFGDELAGLSAAYGNKGEYPAILPHQIAGGLARLGYDSLFGDGETINRYKAARDAYRKTLDESQEQNPMTAFAGDVAGSMVVPGGSAVRGAGALGRAGMGALVGGIQGLSRGAGEAKELEDVPHDAAVSGAIGAGLGGPLGAAFGSRVTSKEMQEAIDLANQYGVKLPNYMVSDSPLAQYTGTHIGRLPFVGSSLRDAAETAREGVANIGRTEAERLSGLAGATGSDLAKDASLAARQSVDAFNTSAKGITDQAFMNVKNFMNNPQARGPLTDLGQEVADIALKYSNAGVKPSPIVKQAMKIAGKPGMTYQDMQFARTQLYKKFEQMKRQGGVDYQEYSQLIGALSRDMERVIYKDGGVPALQAWQKANSLHGTRKDLAKELQTLVPKQTPATGDSAIFNKIFSAAGDKTGNIPAINRLRNTMPPDDWKRVQGAVIGRLGVDEAGDFSPAKFVTAYEKKMSASGKNALLGPVGTPTRDAADAISKLSKVINNAESYRNYSATAYTGAGLAAASALYQDPKSTLGELGAGAIIALALARPATANNLNKYSNALSGLITGAAGQTPRAAEIAARNFAISLATQTGGDKDKYINHFVAPLKLWEKRD